MSGGPGGGAVTHVFFDIGGVLGTNGWDREQRRAASERFGLDADDVDRRHKEVVAPWEEGRMSWDEYLDFVVFCADVPFGREEFKRYVLELSQPFAESVAVVRRLHDAGVALYTLNNESEELNVHRVAHFGLRGLFAAFCSSCWLGVRKPERLMYARAVAIAGADPARAAFVDDREQNLAPARALGMRPLLFRGAERLAADLAALGALDGGERGAATADTAPVAGR